MEKNGTKAKHKTGWLITFEGTEGAGKSTLIHAVAKGIQEEFKGLEVTLTREPGGSRVAEQIRKLILDEPMDPWAELFLYEAARAEHLAKTIAPAMKNGQVVLCDRFTDSSLAYQAYARGLPWKQVQALNKIATQGLTPHLTVLIDVDPALGLKNARDANRFEAEGVQFQTQVRLGFLKARKENPRRWITLKAYSGSPEEMARSVVQRISALIKKKSAGTRGRRRG